MLSGECWIDLPWALLEKRGIDITQPRPRILGTLPVLCSSSAVSPQWRGPCGLHSQPEQCHHQRPAPGAGEDVQGADGEGEGEAH